MDEYDECMYMGFPRFSDRQYEPRRPKHSEEYQRNVYGNTKTVSSQPKQTRSQHEKASSEITKSLCTQQKLYFGTDYDTPDKYCYKKAAGTTEDRLTGNDAMNNQGSNSPFAFPALSVPPRADEYQRRSSQEQPHDHYDALRIWSSGKSKDQQIASNNECDYIPRSESKEKEMEALIKKLQLENKKLISENLEKDRRSNKLAQQMAQMIKIGGNFEDVNDEISCSNITKEYGRLNTDWANLSRKIIKSSPSIPELDVIHDLSELMKFCYNQCSKTADRQIRQFFLLHDTENIPQQHPHLHRILQLRKCTSKEDWVREKIKKDVYDDLRKTHEDTFIALCTGVHADKVKDSMKHFFYKYIECCWLMAISYPSIILNFEVVGKLYVKLLTERWSEYSMNDPVEDMKKPSGTIVEVAWPCVERQDGSGYYAKGEVVIVRRADNTSDE